MRTSSELRFLCDGEISSQKVESGDRSGRVQTQILWS